MRPKSITDTNFEHEVLDADGPMLVDFWAKWCVPSWAIEPILDELA